MTHFMKHSFDMYFVTDILFVDIAKAEILPRAFLSMVLSMTLYTTVF